MMEGMFEENEMMSGYEIAHRVMQQQTVDKLLALYWKDNLWNVISDMQWLIWPCSSVILDE